MERERRREMNYAAFVGKCIAGTVTVVLTLLVGGLVAWCIYHAFINRNGIVG